MIDLTGQRFGRLVALEPTGKKCWESIVWLCRCDCGNKTMVAGRHLRSGHTQSCGCRKKEIIVKRNTTHGYSHHPLYKIWTNIVNRCENKYNYSFKNYGGRNIQICDEWRNSAKAFIEWALANGWEKGLTIERRNNNGLYSPKNCCFITRFKQADNTRKLRWFFAFNLNTGEWDEDNNQMEFSRRHNITNSSISVCLHSRQKTHKNWVFQWLIP